MHIEILGQDLDMPAGFSIQIDDTNPMTNERGSQSVPVTVPPTPRNLRLLAFAGRLEHESPQTIPCRVVEGAYVRTGQINVVSAHRQQGITFNIGFDESEAYSKWKQTKLNSLECPKEEYESHSDMYDHLMAVRRSQVQAPYHIFPITVKQQDVQVDGESRKYYTRLNNFYNEWNWEERDETTVIDGAITTIHLPEGYGVVPFLKVGVVIDIIFAAYGYTVEENPFLTDSELQCVVVLSNVADACVTNTLSYNDLMPSCTVEEFLQALHVRFGMVYSISSNDKTAHIRLVRDIIAGEPSVDLTTSIAQWPSVSYDTPRQLKLSAKTSFSGAQTPQERFEDFIADRKDKYISVRVYDEGSGHLVPVVHEKATGNWYLWDYTNGKATLASSSFFSWNRMTPGVEEEELSSIDECVPVRRREEDFTIEPMYLADTTHHHTFLKLSDKKITDSRNENDTPLAFCLAFNVGMFSMGSSFPFDYYGKQISVNGQPFSFCLAFHFHNGLFAKFWQQYDAVLRHAWNKVEQTVCLPTHQMLHFDMLQPVMLEGQRMIVDSISMQLPSHAKTHAKLTLHTLRLSHADGLEEEQGRPPAPEATSLVWQLSHSTLMEDLEAALEEFRHQDTPSGASYYSKGKFEYSTNGYASPDNDPYLGENPPESFPAFLHRSYTCKAKFTVTVYNLAGAGSSDPSSIDTYVHEVDPFDYSASFQAAYIE